MPKKRNFKGRSYKIKNGEVIFFDEFCKGCGLCQAICPFSALSFSKKYLGVYKTPAIEVDKNKCRLCQLCEKICPDNAVCVYPQRGK